MKTLITATLASACAFAQTIPMTGRAVPSLVPYENALKPILQKWSIPGAALAISDQGRLVYARGFGYADKAAEIPVQPASTFRFASISKTLTGMTIVKLVEEGKLSLDAKFMDLLPNLTPIPSLPFDPRVRNITVRMLLQHTGGWDKDIPSDWTLQFNAASKALGVVYSTLTPDMMTRYAISQKLDFEPGTRYSYSQTGYLILGRVIEAITGKKYEDAVREKILAPAGATGIHLGHALLSQREPDEVRYYDYPGAPLVTGTPTVPGAVSGTTRPYGNYWVEQAEAYGGWIGNTIDLMKYINSLEGRRGSAILTPASLASIVVRPSITPSGEYVGLTWRIDQLTTGGAHWWHSGGATGTRNILARRQNSRDWVVLMNSRPLDEESIISEIFAAFAKAETQVTAWPTNDLFADFGGPTLSTSVQSLNFAYINGAAPPAAQPVQITATTPVAFNIAAPTAAWVKVDRLTGQTPNTINVSVDTAGLPPGSYQSSITISAPQSANGARTIPITLTITAVPTFTSVRNTASQLPVTYAAAASRLLLETTESGTVTFTGSDSIELPAALVGANETGVDVLVPDLPLGDATVQLTTDSGKQIRNTITIEPASPGLFAIALDPIDLSGDPVPLQLAATGLRSQAAVTVTVGDQAVDVVAIETSSAALGVDLITILLPQSLAGAGDVDVLVTAGNGRTSNPVRLSLP